MGKAVKSFEELQVYQQARELTNAIYRITRESAFSRDYGLANQIRRAAVSILSNIAEGFERGTKTEFTQFLYIAKGSCGEVRAQLQIAEDQQYLSTSEYEKLYDICLHINAMLSNFIEHLKKSSYKGTKYT